MQALTAMRHRQHQLLQHKQDLRQQRPQQQAVMLSARP
jgi:hypothetical protein